MRSLRQSEPVPLFPSLILYCLSGMVQNFLVSPRTTFSYLRVPRWMVGQVRSRDHIYTVLVWFQQLPLDSSLNMLFVLVQINNLHPNSLYKFSPPRHHIKEGCICSPLLWNTQPFSRIYSFEMTCLKLIMPPNIGSDFWLNAGECPLPFTSTL